MRSYIFLSVGLGWAGVALAAAILVLWGASWTDGANRFATISAVLAWTTVTCLLLGRFAVRIIVGGRRHVVAISVAGGLLVYASLIAWLWAYDLVVTLLRETQSFFFHCISRTISNTSPIYLVVAIVGSPLAILLGWLHGQLARDLLAAAAVREQNSVRKLPAKLTSES